MFTVGEDVIYVNNDDWHAPLRLHCKIVEEIEGWFKVKFGDSSFAVVKPSRLMKETDFLAL